MVHIELIVRFVGLGVVLLFELVQYICKLLTSGKSGVWIVGCGRAVAVRGLEQTGGERKGFAMIEVV